MSEKLPERLKYNQDYSWVEVENGEAKLGIIQPAADRVKRFVFIDLPEEGEEVEKGDNYTSLEAMKWSGHLSSPVSGKIIEVNDDLYDNPEKINEDSYGSWIVKVELSDPSELEELMNAEEAAGWVEKNM